MPERGELGARQPPEFLAVGRVLRPHGVRGDLLVDSNSEVFNSVEPESVVFVGEQREPRHVRSIRTHRGQFIIGLEGCADRDTAGQLRGMAISVRLEHTEPLPEGVYYRWQILGLAVVNEQGARIGEIAEIIETGANDVYVVRDEAGRQMLLPAIESVILEVDLEAGSISVMVPEGLEFAA
jgi:16S rRNA processing protein RimM